MVPLLAGLVVVVGFLVAAGLAAERSARVRPLLHRIRDLTHPQRGRMGVWIAKDPRIPFGVRLLPITAFVYWVTPIDLIPDPIPAIGYFDDRIVLALAIWCVHAVAAAPLEEHLARTEFLRDAQEARALDASRDPPRLDPASEASDPATP